MKGSPNKFISSCKASAWPSAPNLETLDLISRVVEHQHHTDHQYGCTDIQYDIGHMGHPGHMHVDIEGPLLLLPTDELPHLEECYGL